MHDNELKDSSFRQTIRLVVLLNLAYFVVEFIAALSIRSVSLFADSVDFLEDSSINIHILLALNWTVGNRAKMGKLLALLILVPGIAAIWTVILKFQHPSVPHPDILSLTGAGAFIVNLTCALILSKHRKHSGSLTRAAFLSARNDVLANLAIIAAGIFTMFYHSPWPDVVVGAGIALMNLGAAKEVWEAAETEKAEAKP
jgi:Co/Zn/Cd efflux system component